MTQIYHIKLMNQEEILAELMPSTNKDEYRIKNPLLIQDVVDPVSGVSAIVLIDYVPFAEDKSSVFLNKNMIISKMKIEGAMEKYYKASLHYALAFGNSDTLIKIQSAADKLTKYMEHKLNEGPSVSTAKEIPIDFVEDEEDEMTIDDWMDSMDPASANTTIH
jgi:hypothetical protein